MFDKKHKHGKIGEHREFCAWVEGTTQTTDTRTTEKGRWNIPAALKHGSAVGRPLPEVAFMP
jgi:hypothetical protein